MICAGRKTKHCLSGVVPQFKAPDKQRMTLSFGERRVNLENDHRLDPHRISAEVMRDLYDAGIGKLPVIRCMEYAVNGRRLSIRPVHSKFIIGRR